MFSEFQNMFKRPSDKPTFSGLISQDYSKTPQKFKINGRQIQQKKLLAEGAFGFIWLAEDISSKQEFALKRVICSTPQSLRSAMLQKNILEKLPESPHIVKFYGGLVMKKEERTVVVTLMELCSGGNLFEMLQKREGKGIPEETVKNIASSVLKALVVLHKEGIVHRDIKIENVLVGKDKQLKICDFGSCTSEIVDFATVDKKQYDSIKESIESFTTPMYRPPQIVDPYLKYEVSTKADMWMLGCTLYTMSYFIHPFIEANSVGIANGVFRFPEYPEETEYKVSEKMKDFIRNLLTPNPKYRPSAEKMLALLVKWDDFNAIPLNQDAKRLKEEHLEKEKQMKALNKKVVDYDGDIPMQELMKIQQKLKGQSLENYEKEDVSYISKKEVKKKTVESDRKKVNPQSEIVSKNPVRQKMNPVQNQGSKNNSDLWSSSFASSVPSKSSSSFDAFDAFSKPSPQQTKNNNNFQQFFSSTSGVEKSKNQSRAEVKPSKTESMNLLDL